MELTNIEKLLEKYLKAETTLKEEEVLRAYFYSDKVAPHLKEYSFMFSYFKQSKNETFTKTIQLKPEATRIKKSWKRLSVAISVALLFSSYVTFKEYQEYKQRKQFEQTKETLYMVSVNLNKGNKALYTVSSNINKGKEAIKHLNTYDETVNKVIRAVNY